MLKIFNDGRFGMDIKRDKCLNDLINRINNGDLAGMPNTVAEVKYPGLYFNTLGMEERYPNGESPVDFFNRIYNLFAKFVSQNGNNDENIIVVTHSGVINIIFIILQKLSGMK